MISKWFKMKVNIWTGNHCVACKISLRPSHWERGITFR
jgi:hypothetical protein